MSKDTVLGGPTCKVCGHQHCEISSQEEAQAIEQAARKAEAVEEAKAVEFKWTELSGSSLGWLYELAKPRKRGEDSDTFEPYITVSVGSDGIFYVRLLMCHEHILLEIAKPLETLREAKALAERLHGKLFEHRDKFGEMNWKFSSGMWTSPSWFRPGFTMLLTTDDDGRFCTASSTSQKSDLTFRSLDEAKDEAIREEWRYFVRQFCIAESLGWKEDE